MKTFNADYITARSGYVAFSLSEKVPAWRADYISLVWGSLAGIFIVSGCFLILRDLRALYQIQKASYLIKKINRARIYASDQVQVPFSFWLPGQANVVLPTYLVSRREDYRMVVAHELQHHRHGDTRWVYILWGLKLVGMINPAIYFWNRWIMEIQEFACDETLVDQQKVESQAYIRCLFEVAQSTVELKPGPVCATGLMFLNQRHLLKRRIKKMLKKSEKRIRWQITVVVGGLLALVMGASALASQNLIQDRRVSFAQAEIMAAKTRTSEFPVVINKAVVRQLNRYLGTMEGREFMRESLKRMENYRPLIESYLQRYSVPAEIIAVPIVESGYQNLKESVSSQVKAAGLWQFIRSTARHYGLRVDENKDERMDVDLNTDAAMRYFRSNHIKFNDWTLAALAYNMGELNVQKAIDATGSRDAWVLISKGYEGDKDYLAKLVATILIMNNPDALN